MALSSAFSEKINVVGALKLFGAFLAGLWGGMSPIVQTLIIMMGLDILTGISAGFIQKKLSSDVSWKGMAKKSIILIVVAVAYIMTEPWKESLGFDLGALVAGFYLIHELISIVENAANCGLPVPAVLVDAILKAKKTSPAASIDKLKEEEHATLSSK